MEIKKLLQNEIGEHHPDTALILTETGGIYITRKEKEEQGYPLMKMYSPEQVQDWIKAEIATEINKITVSAKCTHHYNSGGYQSSC